MATPMERRQELLCCVIPYGAQCECHFTVLSGQLTPLAQVFPTCVHMKRMHLSLKHANVRFGEGIMVKKIGKIRLVRGGLACVAMAIKHFQEYCDD